MTNDALKQTACNGIFLPFHLIPGSLSGQKSSVDRDRTRTCNPQIRSLMPYPLGHTAAVGKIAKCRIQERRAVLHSFLSLLPTPEIIWYETMKGCVMVEHPFVPISCVLVVRLAAAQKWFILAR